MKVLWECNKCGDRIESDSKERHKMDTCRCGYSFMDLEEGYWRDGGDLTVIKKTYDKGIKGASMLYVLAALIVTGFIGVAMLKSVTSDSLGNALYRSSESARSAAKSGVIATQSWFSRSGSVIQQDILPLLQGWIDTPSVKKLPAEYRWLTGSDSSFKSIGSGGLKYRTLILGFDDRNFNLNVRVEGIGKGGSRASSRAVIHLDGLEYDFDRGYKPSNALQMDNGNFEFNVHLVVNGNTSIKDTIAINGPADFNGSFRLDTLEKGGNKKARGITINSGNSGNANFKGLLYSAGDVTLTGGVLVLSDNGGIEGVLKVDNPHLYIGNGSSTYNYYFTGGYKGTSGDKVNMRGNRLFAYGADSDYKASWDIEGVNVFDNFRDSSDYFQDLSNPINGSLLSNPPGIPTAVGFPADNKDPRIPFNGDIIDNVTIDVKSAADLASMPKTGGELNSYYDNHRSSLWNDFLVIRIGTNIGLNNWESPFYDDGTPFARKLILLNYNKKVLFSSFYESSDNAVSFVYVDTCGTNEPYFGGVRKFRGFIYVNSTSGRYFGIKTSENTEFIGSIYAGVDAKTNFNSGDSYTNTITYNDDVVSSLWKLGLFSDDDALSDKHIKLKVPGSFIKTSILSISK